jgi:signal transduction histidine kinase
VHDSVSRHTRKRGVIMSEIGRDPNVNGDAEQTFQGPARAEMTPIQAQRLETFGFLAPGVALEFGNLMTIVLGSIEQLRRQSLDGQGREQLQRAESGARQVARLIRQALSLSLPSHKGGTDQLVDLNEALRSFDKMLALVAGENVKVVLELAQQPILVRLEIDQLDLALLDLVRSGSAAISGSGWIVMRTSADGVDRLGDQPTVELSVTATGAAPITITQGPDSNPGMGFATARCFVSWCGGKMVSDPSLGGGMTVRLVFPCAASGNQ